MKNTTWDNFIIARKHYRSETQALFLKMPELQIFQQKLINSRIPSYALETPVVYNKALDDICLDSEIKMILVADNPGRREQEAGNCRYLVGNSGKIAEKFFRDNPVLGMDFRKNVIILNKTPVHTPRTGELRDLCRIGGTGLKAAIDQSQRMMAGLLLEFHKALNSGGNAVPVWITGYSEMKKGGIFEAYTNELKEIYKGAKLRENIFLYRHFSMNQFTIDLKRQAAAGEPLAETLLRIGAAYRQKFLW
ncbi:MAG: hypothetical protein FWH41_08855 [Treponema sp.]|nr:hypothetical protein [Treponema sp.]